MNKYFLICTIRRHEWFKGSKHRKRKDSPVNLLLLPARQLHGHSKLLIKTARHAEGSRQLGVDLRPEGQRGVGGGVQRGHRGGLAEVGQVLALPAGQRDGQGLLDRPETRQNEDKTSRNLQQKEDSFHRYLFKT